MSATRYHFSNGRFKFRRRCFHGWFGTALKYKLVVLRLRKKGDVLIPEVSIDLGSLRFQVVISQFDSVQRVPRGGKDNNNLSCYLPENGVGKYGEEDLQFKPTRGHRMNAALQMLGDLAEGRLYPLSDDLT